MPWLDPTLDIVFHMLFADRRNERLLARLLESVLEPNEPILAVEVLNPELPKDTPLDRGAVLDLYARLESGVRLHIEMQRSRSSWNEKRALFYWAGVYTRQLVRGNDYALLEPVISIHILDFVATEGGDLHSVFELVNQTTGERLSDDLEIHLVELPKLPPDAPRSDDRAVLRWARFLAAKNPKQLEHVAMVYPDLQDAKEALDRLALDPEAQWLARMREHELAHYEATKRREAEAARNTGREEGRRLAMVTTLEQLCTSLGIELDAPRRAELEAASLDELQRLITRLFEERSWPSE
jgi:predicted transposase/invertase (TIGR01784 family)